MITLNKKSLSEQLIDYYKKEIESGKMKPGDEFPSERTLEKQLKISRRTINKVISSLASMGYLFKEQGRTTFVTDSYLKNAILPAGKAIGVFFASPEDVYHPSMAPIFMELCRKLSDSPYSLELVFDKRADLRDLKMQIAKKRLSGLFIIDNTVVGNDFIKSLTIPTVGFNSEYKVMEKNHYYCQVSSDVHSALREAVNFLVKKKRRRIAFVNGNIQWHIDSVRKMLFQSTLQANGLEYDENLVADSRYERKTTHEALKAILEHNPDAIIAADDMVARWLVDELSERGIEVPKKIAVIGFNDMQMYSLRDPLPLTTFVLPAIQLAECAVTEMKNRLEDENYQFQDHLVSMTLCERATT